MKYAHPWIVTGLFLASAFTLARASAQQDPVDVFKTAFEKALDPGPKPDKKLLEQQKLDREKLVRKNARSAEIWIVRTAEAVAADPAAKEKALFDALAESWKAVWKCEFPERQAQYLAGLDARKKKTRDELLARWKPVLREFEGNLEKKDGLTFANILDEIEALAGAFDSEKDLYNATEAYRVYAECCDEPLRGAQGDLHHAWVGYGHAIEMREKLDLKDPVYEEMVKRRAALEARGAGEKGGAVATDPKLEGPKTPVAPAAAVALAFEALPTPDAITRPIYGCDELYPMWNAISLQTKGTATVFPTTSDCPTIVRTGSSDIRFDTNDDKQGDEKIPMTGNITPVRVQIGKGDKKRPWAFFAVVGNQKDSYQGIEVNLAPDDNLYNIYTLGAASVTGNVGATPVRIFDDSLDGVYGGKPQAYGTPGLTPNEFEPWMDSIAIGTSKRARPWSEIQEIDGNFYRLEVLDQGAKLGVSPAEVETGILKLDFKGPLQPTYVVVVGSNDTKDCYYDLVEGGAKGVRVPVGNYALYYGEIRKGKKKQMQKVLILPPLKSAPGWSVREGETTSVTLGAPFGFDFQFEVNGSTLKLLGNTVVVTGSAGERYERPWNCVAKPEVAWRKKGGKVASGTGKMAIGSIETINNKELGWNAVWFPLDLEADAKDKGGAFEVQLSQKKHDLFGKVESVWKE